MIAQMKKIVPDSTKQFNPNPNIRGVSRSKQELRDMILCPFEEHFYASYHTNPHLASLP